MGQPIPIHALGGWTPTHQGDPCGGGHVIHTFNVDGVPYCCRCGRFVDLKKCGCGTDGHEHISRSYCSVMIQKDQLDVAMLARYGVEFEKITPP